MSQAPIITELKSDYSRVSNMLVTEEIPEVKFEENADGWDDQYGGSLDNDDNERTKEIYEIFNKAVAYRDRLRAMQGGDDKDGNGKKGPRNVAFTSVVELAKTIQASEAGKKANIAWKNLLSVAQQVWYRAIEIYGKQIGKVFDKEKNKPTADDVPKILNVAKKFVGEQQAELTKIVDKVKAAITASKADKDKVKSDNNGSAQFARYGF